MGRQSSVPTMCTCEAVAFVGSPCALVRPLHGHCVRSSSVCARPFSETMPCVYRSSSLFRCISMCLTGDAARMQCPCVWSRGYESPKRSPAGAAAQVPQSVPPVPHASLPSITAPSARYRVLGAPYDYSPCPDFSLGPSRSHSFEYLNFSCRTIG